MASQDKGRPLPKFGEWDVNNPASAEGFTVIFNKARDEKKTSAAQVKIVTPRKNDGSLRNGAGYNTVNEHYPKYPPPKKKWFLLWLNESTTAYGDKVIMQK